VTIKNFLNRSYIETNSSKAGFHVKEVLQLRIQIIMLKFLSLIMYQIRNGKLDNTILNDSKSMYFL